MNHNNQLTENNYQEMNSIVIDNCIISKFMGNGISIIPISLAKKNNPLLNVDLLQKITYGSKAEDNLIISKLVDGVLKYEDIMAYNNSI